MAEKFNIRFYDVKRKQGDDALLKEFLEQIYEKKPASARECQLSGSLSVRLERLEADTESHISGEITRIHSVNLPSEVHGDGTRPLRSDTPIGQGVAFRFNHKKARIAFQYDTRIMGPNRFMDYVSSMTRGSSLRLDVVQQGEDAWQRFSDGIPRSFSVRISSPEKLSAVETENEPMTPAIRRIAESYDAPSIRVEVSVGRGRGRHLSDKIFRTARLLYDGLKNGTIAVDSMKARLERVPDEEPMVNFIDDILSFKEQLDLPVNDPDKSYRIRINTLKRIMTENGC